ncbi:hypothetical protein [Streptomyces sp. NPDC008317]|uniref:hypothetical protein n=1 Tax=Streptomyces sp. NPDC008317 TaxID=3364827 RepID=UPI0036E27756
MLLTDLCSALASRSDWLELKSAEYGLKIISESNEKYEVPEISEASTCEPLNPALILLTAPAAVGKSTAAEYMSHLLHAPILDLSTLQVGTGTLEGALSKSLGIQASADFQISLIKGHSVLLVDALDEAEVRSGQANFKAFIRGLTDTALQITDGPSMIVMSRAESAQSLQSVFKEQGLQFSCYEIEAFNQEQSERYLDKRLVEVYSNTGRESVHRKHVLPFSTARQNLFAALASAISPSKEDIWADQGVRDFLGYAPVLDVAAEYLAVDNFASLTNDFGNNSGPGLVHWNLVAAVIDQLLLREQDKFRNQFKETSPFRRYGAARLLANMYSPEEQCARLLSYVENLQLDLDVPASLPVELRDSYESAVSTQLSNHPFLRGAGWFNVIFRDYVTARSLVSPITTSTASSSIRKTLLSASWKHSPMYGYFSYSLGKTTGEDLAYCHSEEVGAIYESLKSMCESGDELFTAVVEHGNRLLASFAVTRIDVDGFTLGPIVFLTHEGTKSISFPRELSRANIYNVPDVMLGGDHISFKFGDGVYLSCRDLLIAAKDVQVYIGESGTPVLMNVGSVLSEGVKVQAETADLAIFSSDLPYPWSRYQKTIDLQGVQSDAREARALFLEFRRIILRFKNAKDGEVAVYQPMMDNLVIGENKRARSVLDFLQSIQCVKLTRSMYLLDLNEYAKLKLSRSQLRDLETSPAVSEVSRRLLAFFRNS